jgi:hypothetical protein
MLSGHRPPPPPLTHTPSLLVCLSFSIDYQPFCVILLTRLISLSLCNRTRRASGLSFHPTLTLWASSSSTNESWAQEPTREQTHTHDDSPYTSNLRREGYRITLLEGREPLELFTSPTRSFNHSQYRYYFVENRKKNSLSCDELFCRCTSSRLRCILLTGRRLLTLRCLCRETRAARVDAK